MYTMMNTTFTMIPSTASTKQTKGDNNMFDYKGFMMDFRIADKFGENAIRDTYNRAFNEWKDNVEYFSSFVMTLNHQIWNWYEKNEKVAKLYDGLWKKADGFARSHFKGEKLDYYYNFLD